jgi:hypothetical protein
MKRITFTAALCVLCLATLRADLTLTQTITIEGQMAAMLGGAQMPQLTMRIKGTKARSDVEAMGQTVTAITDLAQNQVIVLDHRTKTAKMMSSTDTGSVSPRIDVSFKPTGKKQTIDGAPCDEHTFLMAISMAEFTGVPMPPDAAKSQTDPQSAAAVLKDVRMVLNGTIWIAKTAPGAEEYTAFTRAALKSGLFSAASGMKAGQSGGFDKLLAAQASAPGLPYLSEIALTFEGTGPVVDVMKQMGPTKIIQKTASVSTAAIADDMFAIPAGYTVAK